MGGKVQDPEVFQGLLEHRFGGKSRAQQLILGRRAKQLAGRIQFRLSPGQQRYVRQQPCAVAAGVGRKRMFRLARRDRPEVAKAKPGLRCPRAIEFPQADKVGRGGHVADGHAANQPRRLTEGGRFRRAGQQGSKRYRQQRPHRRDGQTGRARHFRVDAAENRCVKRLGRLAIEGGAIGAARRVQAGAHAPNQIRDPSHALIDARDRNRVVLQQERPSAALAQDGRGKRLAWAQHREHLNCLDDLLHELTVIRRRGLQHGFSFILRRPRLR